MDVTPVSSVRVSVSSVGVDRHRLAVSGELDLVTGPGLLAAVKDALGDPGGRDVVIDLTQVTFADASAMGILVLAHFACRRAGGRLTVFGARGIVAEVLALTGVGNLVGLPGRATPVAVGPARGRFGRPALTR